MRTIKSFKWPLFSIPILAISIVIVSLSAQDSSPKPAPAQKSSYAPVVDTESFSAVRNRMTEAKPGIMKRQMDLLAERYDLSNRPAKGAVMDRSKPLQEGVRVKLPPGVTWAQLADMTPDQIRDKNLFPQGFLPLPHANHPEGGMVFPKFEIQELIKQEQRDLTRFDLDFDLPDTLSFPNSRAHFSDDAARPRRCLERVRLVTIIILRYCLTAF